MKVTIYHNIDRDSFFGLNTRLSSDKGIRNVRKEAVPGSHALVKVFEYEVAEDAETALENEVAFHRFNVGTDELSQAYRARRLRSLSVGDVIGYGPGNGPPEAFFACASFGWDPVRASDLRVVQGDEAVALIRERFEFRPSETELSVTVPLA